MVASNREKNAPICAKRASTRAARHTMGPKQKRGVTGHVVGVTVTPVMATAPSAASVESTAAPATVTTPATATPPRAT